MDRNLIAMSLSVLHRIGNLHTEHQALVIHVWIVRQSIKNLLKKAEESNGDTNIALLEYRNTPIDGIGKSPAELLMNRSLRLKIPTTRTWLEPKPFESQLSKLQLRQMKQKYFHDRTCSKLPHIEERERSFVCRIQKIEIGNQESSNRTLETVHTAYWTNMEELFGETVARYWNRGKPTSRCYPQKLNHNWVNLYQVKVKILVMCSMLIPHIQVRKIPWQTANPR